MNSPIVCETFKRWSCSPFQIELDEKTVFERIIAQHPDRVFLNCSEAGLALAGAQNVPFQEVLQALPAAIGIFVTVHAASAGNGARATSHVRQRARSRFMARLMVRRSKRCAVDQHWRRAAAWGKGGRGRPRAAAYSVAL